MAVRADQEPPLLSIQHVTKDYSTESERVRALDSVSLEVDVVNSLRSLDAAAAANRRC